MVTRIFPQIIAAVKNTVMVIVLLSAVAGTGMASEDDTGDARIPNPVEDALVRLLGVVDAAAPNDFDPATAGPVIDFVLATRQPTPIAYTGAPLSDTSAYYPFDIQTDLNRFLQIAYNPEIPSAMIMPDSVRLSQWRPDSTPMPKLWEHLSDLSAPVIARGIEYTVNTPDPNSGAYFAYDLNRAMILFRHGGKRVLFSLSRQTDRSDVGKKGVAVGDPERWDFLYTGQKGLTLAGLGWVSSYMYDSYSLSVYIEPAGGRPLIHAGMFKWIRAGWSSINMVKRRHIHAGLERHVRFFKSIIENPALPPADELAAAYARICRLDRRQLSDLFAEYLERLEKGNLDNRSRGWLQCIREDDSYIKGMSTEELQAAAAVEYIKHLLGRSANPGLLSLLQPS